MDGYGYEAMTQESTDLKGDYKFWVKTKTNANQPL